MSCSSSNLVLQLINEILDLSKVESSDFVFVPPRVYEVFFFSFYTLLVQMQNRGLHLRKIIGGLLIFQILASFFLMIVISLS